MSDHSTTRSGATKSLGFSAADSAHQESGASLDSRKRNASGYEEISAFEKSKNIDNKKKAKVEYSRLKRRFLRHVTLIRIVIVVLIFGVIGLLSFLAAKSTQALNIPLYYNVAYNFIKAPVGQLATYNDRVNILIMGDAGGARSYDSPDLTDTMMLVSISLGKPDIKIISIPRDTWIPEIQSKINSAYYWGTQKTPYFNNLGGNGISFAKAITSEITGVPIQYGVVIDFSGFKDVIDAMGGINVNVANSFTDYFYPIPGKENDTCGGGDPQFMCRYETISFKAGEQFMDGATALKFVRSRHAEGVEGTDLAREARQQKVIDAVKVKLMNKSVYGNPQKDIAILKAVLSSVKMDMDYPTAAIIARKTYDARNSISNYLIPEELLVNPPVSNYKYGGQSVFTPKLGDGNWKDINAWFENLLK